MTDLILINYLAHAKEPGNFIQRTQRQDIWPSYR